jgi:hypothetical protein
LDKKNKTIDEGFSGNVKVEDEEIVIVKDKKIIPEESKISC